MLGYLHISITRLIQLSFTCNQHIRRMDRYGWTDGWKPCRFKGLLSTVQKEKRKEKKITKRKRVFKENNKNVTARDD